MGVNILTRLDYTAYHGVGITLGLLNLGEQYLCGGAQIV